MPCKTNGGVSSNYPSAKCRLYKTDHGDLYLEVHNERLNNWHVFSLSDNVQTGIKDLLDGRTYTVVCSGPDGHFFVTVANCHTQDEAKTKAGNRNSRVWVSPIVGVFLNEP